MRTRLVALATALLVTPVLAQDKPDFTGSWKLNTEKSDAPQTAGPGRPGGARGMGGGMGPAIEVFATQMGNKLVLEQKWGEQTRSLSYYLDGSASRNPGMRNREMVSKARWDGNALIIESSMSFESPMGAMTVQMKEVRTLSDDGRMMTVVTTTTTPRGETTRTLVYDKQ